MSGGDLLCLVVDCNACWWGHLSEQHQASISPSHQTEQIKDISESACDCHNSAFAYAPCGHVVTGDLHFVKNHALMDIMSKGTKYRVPRPYNWDEVEEASVTALDNFIEKAARKYKEDFSGSGNRIWKEKGRRKRRRRERATELQIQLQTSHDRLLACMIDALATFCNAHLAQNAHNRLLVLAAAHGLRSNVIFSSDKAERTMDPCQMVKTGLRRCLQESVESSSLDKECPLAAPLTTCLCHINRARREQLEHAEKQTARILIVKLSGSRTEQQQQSLLTLLFAAQKQAVVVDVCAVGQSSAIMHQAADITSGLHVLVQQPAGLLQYLLTIFLPSPTVREHLVCPSGGDVDYRPACVCHQRLVSIGWVCSVCLAVLCQFTPICPTCQTVFNIPVLPKAKKRKRQT